MTWQELILLGYTEDDGSVFENLLKIIVLENLKNEEHKNQLYCALCHVAWYRTDKKIMFSADQMTAASLIAEFEGTVQMYNHRALGVVNMAWTKYYWLVPNVLLEDWIKERFAREGWYPGPYDFESEISISSTQQK